MSCLLSPVSSSETTPLVSSADDDNNAIVSLHENVISLAEADSLLTELSQTLNWKIENDNWGPQSRATCYYGESDDCVFTYVGLSLTPHPWTKTLQKLRNVVAKACGIDPPQILTACLANHYPIGEGHIPWHYDEVRAHAPHKIVASLSIGGPRRFQLRRRSNNNNNNTKIEILEDRLLPSGSVLLMRGSAQEKYEHCVPLTSDQDPHRISLTFRSIIPGCEQGKEIAVDQCCTSSYQEGEE